MRKQTKIAALVSAAALLAIGASMTALAATGWVETSEGEYQWLDSYGDPVYDEWKRGTGTSADKWYYLGEDGYMLKDQIFRDTADHIFYVDENGERKTNYWYSLDNEDDVDLNEDGEEESILWMYFQSNGKAVRGTSQVIKWSGNTETGDRFVFNDDGYMISGWYKPDGSTKKNGGQVIYYLGSEDEGNARTGWQYLPVPPEHVCPDDETAHWYYFDPATAQAYVTEDGEKYINGKWYSFGEGDDPAALRTTWTAYSEYMTNGATPPTPPTADYQIYNYTNGSQGYGWAYAADVAPTDCWDDTHVSAQSGSHWYYLVTYRDGDKKQVTRSIAFNENSGYDRVAKSINGKTYLFDGKGRMMYGLVELSNDTPDMDTWKVVGGIYKNSAVTPLKAGTYYFNAPDDPKASNAGQMVTGRQTIYVEEDTQSYNYYFAKKKADYKDTDGTVLLSVNAGEAYKDAIVDGTLYDSKGRRVDAQDNNSYAIVTVSNVVYVKGNTAKLISGDIVVSSTGRVKTSGTVRIDDVKYKVDTTTLKATIQE